ncbi:hypothetical protein [Tsuneonella sp. HG222]
MRAAGGLAVLALAACDRLPPSPEPADARALVAVATAAGPPDASSCKLAEPLADAERIRSAPLPVPPALAAIVSASVDVYAVHTLGGGTYCVDTRWMEKADAMELSADGRFLSFGWTGYESYGHLLVDRSGAGQEIDTGQPPKNSPSGKLLAALEWSESGYGALQGLAVWRIDPVGVTLLAKEEDLPFLFQWQIDRWEGDRCLEVSAVANEDVPSEGWVTDPAVRRHFTYRARDSGWIMAPASGPAGCGTA